MNETNKINSYKTETINTDLRFGFGMIIPNESYISQILEDFDYHEVPNVCDEDLKKTYCEVARCIEICISHLMNGNMYVMNGEFNFWDKVYEYMKNDEDCMMYIEKTHIMAGTD
tara:strand:+ start:469 stop:810 length:342 start_codon:yes stop_codon:yes gene_type:complete